MATGTGQRISGSTRIPVGDMAKANIREIFPHVTEAQARALREGTPIPPSEGWAPPPPQVVSVPTSSAELRRLHHFVARLMLEGFDDHRKVSCILAFGMKQRINMAKTAVNQFVAQSYPNKQLVIVNNTEQRVTTHDHPDITEIDVNLGSNATIGALRNAGLDACTGDYIKPCWDDDDHFDPHLLAYQMWMNNQENLAVLLSRQIRVHVWKSIAYIHKQDEGIPNTMIVPKSPARFDAAVRYGEDTLFWMQHWANRTKVINNNIFPFDTLNIAVHHDNNLTPFESFMVDHSTSDHVNRWQMRPEHAEHVRSVMLLRGLTANPGVPETAQAPSA